MYLTTKLHNNCRYCAEVLASLPFTSPDEPLYLIYDINRVIQLRAGAVEANLKNWTSMYQQQEMVGMPRDTGDVMHEPGGCSDQNLVDVSQMMLGNTCSTPVVNMAKLQVS